LAPADKYDGTVLLFTGAAGADARSEVQRVRWGRKLAPPDKYDGTVLLFTGAAGADAHVQRVKESLSSTISSLMGSMFSRWGHVGANWQIRWNGLVFYRNSWCRLQLRRRRLAHSSIVHSSAASEPVCASPMRPLATITLTTCRCLLQEQLVGADAQRGTASERVIVVHDWLTRQ